MLSQKLFLTFVGLAVGELLAQVLTARSIQSVLILRASIVRVVLTIVGVLGGLPQLQVVHNDVPDALPEALRLVVRFFQMIGRLLVIDVLGLLGIGHVLLLKTLNGVLVCLKHEVVAQVRVLLAEVVPQLLGAVLEALEQAHDRLDAFALLLFERERSILFVLIGTRGCLELRLKLILDVSQILLKLYTQLLGLRNTNLLALVPSLEAPLDVHVVVLDNSKDDIRGRDAIGSLGGAEHALFFHVVVDVSLPGTAVGQVVVRHVVDVVLFEEVEADDPGAGADDLVDPLAVLEYLRSLLLRHHDLTFFRDSLLVATDTHN